MPAHDRDAALQACESAATASRLGYSELLPGPTGESNRYRLLPRGDVWAMPQTALGLVHQLAAAYATGNHCRVVPAPSDEVTSSLTALLQIPELSGWIAAANADALTDNATPMQALLFEGDGDALLEVGMRVAARDGNLVRIDSRRSDELAAGHGYTLSALVHEQSISTNTAAAGGNAQLMTMA